MKPTAFALVVVALALVGATACGAGKAKRFVTATEVASLLRHTWGKTEGSPSFDYSCRRLDSRGELFTCLVRDRTDTVRLATFDVVCRAARCHWMDYPAYVG